MGISPWRFLGRKIVDNVVLLLFIKGAKFFHIIQSLNILSVFFIEAMLVPFSPSLESQ